MSTNLIFFVFYQKQRNSILNFFFNFDLFISFQKNSIVEFTSQKLNSKHLNFHINLPNTSNDLITSQKHTHKYKSVRLLCWIFFSQNINYKLNLSNITPKLLETYIEIPCQFTTFAVSAPVTIFQHNPI